MAEERAPEEAEQQEAEQQEAEQQEAEQQEAEQQEAEQQEPERRRRAADIDIRRTWQVLVGALLLAAGPVLILLAYRGASRTPFVAEQIPYLLSGGLLGLGLMVVGAFFFWAHWLYRQYERQEFHQARLVAEIRRLRAEAPGGKEGARAVASNGSFVMTDRGSVVHLASCPVIETKGAARILSAEDLRRPGLKACQICEPVLPTSV
jgi:hypothetical protein